MKRISENISSSFTNLFLKGVMIVIIKAAAGIWLLPAAAFWKFRICCSKASHPG